MPETPGLDAFHAHLDKCERCRCQPFNLCREGAALLAAASLLAGAPQRETP